ncbi:hypothetical protein GDO81_019263, partial [Engystomops pustulosus]
KFQRVQDHPISPATAEMKPGIIRVFIVSFLFSIAAALDCYYCHGRNNVTCKQEIITCMKGDQCVIISEEFVY